MKSLLLALVALAALTGCHAAAPPLPTVRWDTLEEAQQFLVEQQAAIDNVQAELTLRFTSPPPKDETNTFDGALVMQGDDRFRLRTWKLNQTIFDLTVTPEGTYVIAADEMKEESPDSEAELAELANNLSAMLRGADFAKARFSRTKPTLVEAAVRFDAPFFIWATWPDDSLIVAIDRRTLSPMNWWVRGDQMNPGIQIQSEYSDYEGVRWYRYVIVSGEFGRLQMTFRDVELNGELNPRAFKPSRRAVRIDAAKVESSETMSP